MPVNKSRLRSWSESLVSLACIIVMVTVAKVAIAEAYYVPSGSMQPTLLIGDQLLATKYPYGYSAASLPASVALPNTQRIFGALPKRGDVVVFLWPGEASKVGVKRVIGLPGDHIALRSGRLWINSRPVGLRADGVDQAEAEDGSQMPAARYIETLPDAREHAILRLRAPGDDDNMREVVVPPEHLFVMGDNRDNSADSRFPVSTGGVGMLPAGNLIGRAERLVGSWDIGVKRQPLWTWPSGLRFSRFFTAIH
jgi:signal peptidase I